MIMEQVFTVRIMTTVKGRLNYKVRMPYSSWMNCQFCSQIFSPHNTLNNHRNKVLDVS